jgi:hypothetical protein
MPEKRWNLRRAGSPAGRAYISATMAEALAPSFAEGAACRPNISPAGRRRRVRFGWTALAVSGAGLVACVALRVPAGWRVLLALPAAAAAIGFLQARRNTCIRRAAEGVFELDDFSTVPAAADDVAGSRKVAAGIRRDAVLLGLLGAAIGAASAALR